jgi:hypothetical protein
VAGKNDSKLALPTICSSSSSLSLDAGLGAADT